MNKLYVSCHCDCGNICKRQYVAWLFIQEYMGCNVIKHDCEHVLATVFNLEDYRQYIDVTDFSVLGYRALEEQLHGKIQS